MKITPARIKGIVAALVAAVVASGAIDVGQGGVINAVAVSVLTALAAFGIVPDASEPQE